MASAGRSRPEHPDGTPPGAVTLHASAVAFRDRGLLILGASGAGKSTLALQMMALGCCLVADDRVIVYRESGEGAPAGPQSPGPESAAAPLRLACPPALNGLIEARGIGLLNAETAPANLSAAVDLDRTEPERLPPHREIRLAGAAIPLFLRSEGPGFAAGLIQYLKGGRAA
jgi:HPr kinase/phosphorylase